MHILVEVSLGELIDKVTILELKRDRFVDQEKRNNVLLELEALTTVLASVQGLNAEVLGVLAELKVINAKLWDIEEELRLCERRLEFGPQFIELARQVYITNDRRAELKRKINFAAESRIVEEKSYLNPIPVTRTPYP